MRWFEGTVIDYYMSYKFTPGFKAVCKSTLAKVRKNNPDIPLEEGSQPDDPCLVVSLTDMAERSHYHSNYKSSIAVHPVFFRPATGRQIMIQP
ncbi:MAG: hypothetical protein QGG83_06270 [Candidatus Woesearchaeota archaeon]|nr:hypothetical protein [Candidatus Woesearchaeota archaeon]